MHYHSKMYPLGASLSFSFSLLIILLVLGSLGFLIWKSAVPVKKEA